MLFSSSLNLLKSIHTLFHFRSLLVYCGWHLPPCSFFLLFLAFKFLFVRESIWPDINVLFWLCWFFDPEHLLFLTFLSDLCSQESMLRIWTFLIWNGAESDAGSAAYCILFTLFCLHSKICSSESLHWCFQFITSSPSQCVSCFLGVRYFLLVFIF